MNFKAFISLFLMTILLGLVSADGTTVITVSSAQKVESTATTPNDTKKLSTTSKQKVGKTVTGTAKVSTKPSSSSSSSATTSDISADQNIDGSLNVSVNQN